MPERRNGNLTGHRGSAPVLMAALMAALVGCSSGGSTGTSGPPASTPTATTSTTSAAVAEPFCESLHHIQVGSRAALKAVVTRTRTHLAVAITAINRAFAAAERQAPPAAQSAVDQLHRRLQSLIKSVDNARASVPDRAQFAPVVGSVVNVASKAAGTANCPPRTAEG